MNVTYDLSVRYGYTQVPARYLKTHRDGRIHVQLQLDQKVRLYVKPSEVTWADGLKHA